MSSDRLLVFIKAMNQAERRYFKQTLRQHSSNSETTNYARLFDYLCKVNTIDKKLLLKKCSFISAGQLTNIKVRLYNRLLQSSRAFYANSNDSIEVYQFLSDYEILKTKRLYNQCLQVLQKAEKRVNKTNEFLMQRQILEHQKQILEIRLKGKKNKQLLSKVVNKLHIITVTSDNIEKLKILSNKSYDLFKTHGRIVREKTVLDEISQHLKKIEKEVNDSAKSDYWKVLFNYEAAHIFGQKGDLKKAERYMLEILCVFDENSKMIKAQTFYYFKTLNYLSIIYNSLKDAEKALAIIEKMRIFKTNHSVNKDLELLIFENSNFQEIEVYLQARNFKKAVTISETVIPQLKVFDGHIHNINEHSKYYRIALSYFGDKQFKKSLKWINHIMNYEELNYRKDILSSVQILNLMVHYELKNYDIVQNKTNSVINYLKKIERYLPFEKTIIKSLKTLSDSSSKQKHYRSLLNQLQENQNKNELEKYALQYFDPIAWVESKLNN